MLYYTLGGKKKLNEIVFAGSHDAGITKGTSYTKTQSLDILGQAMAGVRLFDLRIAGAGADRVPTAYHGKARDGEIKYGGFGEELAKMLQEARDFVMNTASEFLILKFDKCDDYAKIAEACKNELRSRLYTGGNSLNEKTLDDLRSKVVVVFKDGAPGIDPSKGIFGFKRLEEGDQYASGYSGLQYCGKGGTFFLTPGAGLSTWENVVTQGSKLAPGRTLSPETMGMMYWTTTGFLGNIEKRDGKMWADDGARMRALWQKHAPAMQQLLPQALDDSLDRMPLGIDAGQGGGAVAKRFLPNIVMIDFADPSKCRAIHGLNKLLPNDIEEAATHLVRLRKKVKVVRWATARTDPD